MAGSSARSSAASPDLPMKGHHPDIDIRWQRIRFILTTHDAGDKITARDLEMAAHIDAIAAGHGAKPVPPETS
jgi:pterin-4a-carbinolamine dehydratase